MEFPEKRRKETQNISINPEREHVSSVEVNMQVIRKIIKIPNCCSFSLAQFPQNQTEGKEKIPNKWNRFIKKKMWAMKMKSEIVKNQFKDMWKLTQIRGKNGYKIR